MLDLISEAIIALQEETASYPQNVQIWMKLMGVSFLASIVFVYSRAGARWRSSGHGRQPAVEKATDN